MTRAEAAQTIFGATGYALGSIAAYWHWTPALWIGGCVVLGFVLGSIFRMFR